MKKYIPPVILLLMLMGCKPKPAEINYGTDVCHECKMTIVDQQHAAETVTCKGKVFKFDAIECMANYHKKNKEQCFAFLLVNDYTNPKALIDAQDAHFLISKAIPSPMGAFLTAFPEKSLAQNIKNEKGGEIYSWKQLLNHLDEVGFIHHPQEHH